VPVSLTHDERETLEGWVRARSTPRALVVRSLIILRLADGFSGRAVARRLGISRRTVDLWRDRYRAGRCDELTREKPGRGRKPRGSVPHRASG
jgi:transposase